MPFCRIILTSPEFGWRRTLQSCKPMSLWLSWQASSPLCQVLLCRESLSSLMVCIASLLLSHMLYTTSLLLSCMLRSSSLFLSIVLCIVSLLLLCMLCIASLQSRASAGCHRFRRDLMSHPLAERNEGCACMVAWMCDLHMGVWSSFEGFESFVGCIGLA